MANNLILDLFFPKRCVSCSAIGQYICESCAKKIEKYPNQKCLVCLRPSIDGITHSVCRSKLSIDGAITAFAFKGPVKDAIYKLKYQQIADLADHMVELLLADLEQTKFITNSQFKIIAVPLHHMRQNKRGYNQAEILARKFSDKTDMELLNNILIKVKNTKPQVELSRQDRFSNLKGAFSLNDRKLINKQHILLVDDVRTTGATLRNCAQVLKRAGAKTVWGLTIAAN